MKRLLSIAWLLSLAGCGHTAAAVEEQADQIEEWDHGFKTDNVVATRYRSELGGLNIGFQFPKNIHNYDHPDVFDWFGKYNGFVIQGGGAPGAEMFVFFDGVKDRESANEKLRVVVPELSKFMRTIR